MRAGQSALDHVVNAANGFSKSAMSGDPCPTLRSVVIGQKLFARPVGNYDLPAFDAFVARSQSEAPKAKPGATPLWRRLMELRLPLLMIYGRNDRANAFERANLLKSHYPQLAIHIAADCKHLVPWDAEEEVASLAIPFLKS
jgi:pimeloyl-ACP methyl ester carboxylesterase